MSKRIDFKETDLKGLYRVVHKPIGDERGFLNRLFCANEFKEVGFVDQIAQINYTFTKKKGTIRGMHFQNSPKMEIKIVTCLKGYVLDIALDLRKDSDTFLQWHAEELSEKSQSGLYIPRGFAHGFQTLTENCQLLYFHSEYYSPDNEDALNALDPKLGIVWPLEVTEMSIRDKNHPMQIGNFEGLSVK